MPTIAATDGSPLHYEVHGTGATGMLLLHGMGGTLTTWHPLLERLDLSQLRVVTPDLRGHGKSHGGEASFNFAQLDQDLWAVIDAAGLDRVIIVAQSGSGKNAICAALSKPTRVRGMVLTACSGMGEVPLPRETIKWFFDAIEKDGRVPSEFDPWFSEKLGALRTVVDREYAATPRTVLDASAELWVYTPVVEQASRITQPVLVIAGSREPLYHPEFQRINTLSALAHASMEIFDCGHLIPFEEPVALARSLTRFCAALSD
ncbi:MAG: alpha/beta hydrolase [Opitutaceae bacterium]